MKLKITSRRKTETFTNMWKLSNILLNNQWDKKITRKLENTLKKIKMKTQHARTYRMQ